MTEPQAKETSGDIIRRAYARLPKARPDRSQPAPAIISRTYARSADASPAAPSIAPTADDDDDEAQPTATPHDDLADASTHAAGDDAARTPVPDMAKTDPADPKAAELALLRVLAGPHRGAELSLHPGRYAIGTDQGCDIVLGDSRVAAQHAFLVVGEDLLAIEPGEGAVAVDGAEIDGRVALAAYQPVRLGSTVLAVGPTDVQWPEIDLAGSEPTGDDDSGDDAEADAASEAEGDPTAATDAQASGPADEGGEASRATDRARADAVAGSGWRGRWRAGAAAALVALLAVVASVAADLWYTYREAAVVPAVDRPAPRAQAQSIVDQLGLTDQLEVKAAAGSGDGRVVVEGYVGTEAQRRELLQALQPLVGSIDVRVWSTALLETSIAQALNGMRIDLTVADVTDGKVALTGLLPATATEVGLKQALQSDIPGIVSIDLQVVSQAAANHWLRDQIGGLGIPEQSLSITIDGHRFVVDGRLPARLKAGWQDTVTAFGQRFGAQLSLSDDVTFLAAAPKIDRQTTPAAFDFVLRAINVGPPAYITLDTDEKFLIGSRLSNGMILEDVKANGVVLRDGETRHLVEISKDSGQVDRVRQLETK